MRKHLLVLILLGPTAWAQNVPSTVMYTGKLTDGGAPVDGVRNFDLRLYDDATAGTLVWDEQYFSVPVTLGLFNIVMGSSGNPVDPVDLAGDRWLQVAVGGVPLLPRVKVHSVPYAILASDADSLQGFAAVDFAPATASCPADSAIRAFDALGNAICESDDVGTGDITGVTAGIGLMTGGTTGDVTLDVDFASFGTCPGTQKVTGWNAGTGALECGPDADSGGTVQSIDTGSGLTGGPIADSGTISVATGGITTTHLSDSVVFASVQDTTPAEQFAVTDGAPALQFNAGVGLAANFTPAMHRVTFGIAPGGVGATELAANAVTNAKVADDAIGSAEIAVDSIAAVDIAANAIGNAEMADNAIGSAEIATNAVGMDEISVPNASAQTSFSFVSGPNYSYPVPAFTPTVNGACLVISTWFVTTGSKTSPGPFFRIAIKTGVTDGDDAAVGGYAGDLAGADDRANFTRAHIVAVSAGTSYQFGCYLNTADATWVGDTVYCRTSYLCF